MPRIPTYQSEASIRTGSTGPQASALAFNSVAGLEAVGHGLYNLSGSLQQIAEQRNIEKDVEWKLNTISAYERDVAKFQIDNQDAQDYADRLNVYLKERQSQALENAPSRRAVQMFRNEAIPHGNRVFIHATEIQERNRLDRLGFSMIDRGRAISGTYHNEFETVGPVAAFDNADNAFSILRQEIDKSLPEKVARPLKDEAAFDFVISVAEKDPGRARMVLDKYPFDSQKRDQLLRHIEQAQAGQEQLFRTRLEWHNADTLDNASRKGTVIIRPSDDQWALAYGDKAQVHKEAFERQAQPIEQANKLRVDWAGANPSWQEAQLAKQNFSGDVGNQVAANLKKMVDDNQKFVTEDPAGYIFFGNPHVNAIYSKARSFPAGSPEQKEAFKEARRANLEYQGYTPVTIHPTGIMTQYNTRYYQSLPTGLRKPLIKEEAKALVASINKGQPEEAVSAFQSIYADNDYPMGPEMVFRQLEGEGLRGDYRAVLALHDKPNDQIILVNALRQREANIKLIKEADKEDVDAINKHVQDRSGWKTFLESYNPNSQRSTEMAEYQSAIQSLAYFYKRRGLSNKDSAERAVKTLVNDVMATMNINGTEVMIDRTDPDVPNALLEEGELARYEEGFNALLHFFPSDKMEYDNFALLSGMNQANLSDKRTEIIRKAVQENGRFIPEADGRSLSLYYRNDEGAFFQPLFVDGGQLKPLVVPVKQVWQFVNKFATPQQLEEYWGTRLLPIPEGEFQVPYP